MSIFENYIEENSQAITKGKSKKLPINVRLNLNDIYKLEELSKKFNKSKSELSAEILAIAIEDVWKTAQMPPLSEQETELEKFITEASKPKRKRPKKVKQEE